DHAGTEIEVLDPLESGLFHQGLELFLVRMNADGLGEIAVAVAVVGDQFAQQRQYLVRTGVVTRLQRLPDAREFEHQQTSAGLQHTVHFRQRTLLARHIAQPESHAYAIKMRIRKWQLLGVALDCRREYARVEHAVASACQHRRIDIRKYDLAARADAAGELDRKVGGAAGDVEHALPGPESA